MVVERCSHGATAKACIYCRIAELEAQVVDMRKLLVRVKMYVPDSQQELHARIHYAAEQ